ncbi:MAG: immune inhibitor A, partial [Limisphaera sp.]|nr:immune inhibitor A [Limisphaera sp.]
MKVYVSFWQPPAVLFSFCRTVRGLLGWSVVLASITGASAYPFSDSFESGLGQWNTEGPWGLTSTRFASPTHAVTDSPGAFYTNRTDAALTLAGSLDLTSAVRPALGFLHQHALEPGYDFGRVEISTDGGVTWVATPLGAYTGHLSTMTREQIDLTPFAGLSNVRLRFRLVTDGSVVMDGWYIDDVVVAEAPAPVTLSATLTNRNSATLAWTASVEPDFTAYRLYRSLTPGVDWRTAHVVAELPNRAATHFTDITLAPKTTYYYRLAVVNAKGLLGLGNEIAVTTHPGMDYPFVDNGEAEPNMWIADPPWSLSDEDAASPTRAWSDSPGTNYVHGIGSQSLTLAAPLALAGHAVSPVLSFNHKYDFAAGDAGYVEISLNNGADWTSLGSFTGTSSNQWRRARYSLAAHTNAAAVLLRFRITTDTSANADGWHIDDISVAESPAVVPAPVLDEITSHTLRISWPAASDPFFAAYAVFRSTTPGVGINSTLAAWITNPATTSFVDTNLALDTLYYYRVYVVNAFGAFSPDSPAESSARTLNHPLPFRDGFEGALLGWTLTGTWGRNTNESHSGVACLSDSPGFNYANSSDSIAQTAVNLTGSRWPVLRFWDRFRLADNDWARVEVSTDGSSWTAVYGAAGVQAQWREQRIDLSPWKNQSNLRIRFHLWSDGGGTEDGWSIDDLAVEEHASGAVGLPFQETFESGLDRWLAASWAVDTNGPQGGGFAVRDTPAGRLNPDTRYELGLGGELDLRGAVNPQLVFWVRGQLAYRTRFRVQCSSDGGLNWGDFYGLNHDWNADWTRVQVSLQSLTNRLVRLRFVTWSEWGSAPAQDLWIDNVVLQEMPPPVSLQVLTPGLRSVELEWTASTLGPAFKRYEVYRSTGPNVELTHTRIGVVTNAAVTRLTDTGLSIGATYYYRVFVVDTNEVFSPSNERSVTTVPVGLPLSDPLETTDQWVTTGSWGIAEGGRSGRCLSDSPTGDYGNSTDTYALTAVNLTGSRWPVLRFWDRFRLADNDWA